MLGKVYFWGMVLVVLFVNYYQFLVVRSFGALELIYLGRDLSLAIGGFAYFFKRKLFEARIWRYIYYFLVVQLGISFIMQVVPNSYLGDFSILNGNLLTNIFVFLLVNSFYIPLYICVYRLSEVKISTSKKSAKKKK